jgi:hypothetical protein
MLEYDLIKKYADTMGSANEILFLDKIIQREFRLGVDDLDFLEDYAKELLDSVQKWRKGLVEYQKIAKLLKKDLNEVSTKLQKDADNANDEEIG